VAQVGGMPLISHTWSAGRLVFSTHYLPALEPVAALRDAQRVAA